MPRFHALQPSGLTATSGVLPNAPYANGTTATVHAWRRCALSPGRVVHCEPQALMPSCCIFSGHWFTRMYAVADYSFNSTNGSTFVFGRGGFQVRRLSAPTCCVAAARKLGERCEPHSFRVPRVRLLMKSSTWRMSPRRCACFIKVNGSAHLKVTCASLQLDAPSEWFYDEVQGTLTLYWNASVGTPPPGDAEALSVPQVRFGCLLMDAAHSMRSATPSS